MVLSLMISATLYHGLIFYFFEIDYYYHLQNLIFNILFIIFIGFCYKKILDKSDLTLIGVNLFVLLIFTLQLEISMCEYMNFYSYYRSGELEFLEIDHISSLEQYIIPLCSSLIETFGARCLEDEVVKNVAVPTAESYIDSKKYAGKAAVAVEVIQGVSLGLAGPIIYKGLGGVTPLFVQLLPPMVKTAGLGVMGAGGYLLVEIAKMGK
jgi:hypothetical protein